MYNRRQQVPEGSILTFQFGPIWGALPSLHYAVIIVPYQPVACQDLIQIYVVILGGILIVPADPGSFNQGQGYQKENYEQLHDAVTRNQ